MCPPCIGGVFCKRRTRGRHLLCNDEEDQEDKMLNQDQIKTRWPQIRVALKNMWGSLQEEELDRTGADLSAVAALVQEKTGEERAQIKNKLDHMLESFDNETDKGINPDVSSYERSPVIPVNEDWTPRH